MVRLSDINESNPWWRHGTAFSAFDMDLKRYSAQRFKVRRALPKMETGRIYMIKGPRRVGKTVALKLLVLGLLEHGVRSEDILYFSFDGVRSDKELYNLLEDFLAKVHKSSYLLLDEIQNVDRWEFRIKHLYDSGALQNTVTVITGSIAHLLKREMLPGRGIEGNVYSMRTLSFNRFCLAVLADASAGIGKTARFLGEEVAAGELETLGRLLDSNGITLNENLEELYGLLEPVSVHSLLLRKMFDLYIRTGGYPLAINSYFANNENGVGQDVADEVYNYIINDAATLAGSALGDPGKAMQALKAISLNVGNGVSNSKLAGYVGLDHKTFASYSGRLENSYAVLSLSGADAHLQDVRIKKMYFADVFMHYAVGSRLSGYGMNAYYSELVNIESIGAIIEEVVAGALIRVRETDSEPYGSYLRFLRKSNRELDFVFMRGDGSRIGIEVKYQNEPSPRNDVYRVKAINEYIILSKDTLKKGSDYLMTPAYLFLALLKQSPHSI